MFLLVPSPSPAPGAGVDLGSAAGYLLLGGFLLIVALGAYAFVQSRKREGQ